MGKGWSGELEEAQLRENLKLRTRAPHTRSQTNCDGAALMPLPNFLTILISAAHTGLCRAACKLVKRGHPGDIRLCGGDLHTPHHYSLPPSQPNSFQRPFHAANVGTNEAVRLGELLTDGSSAGRDSSERQRHKTQQLSPTSSAHKDVRIRQSHTAPLRCATQ